jgi:hypothetical protein
VLQRVNSWLTLLKLVILWDLSSIMEEAKSRKAQKPSITVVAFLLFLCMTTWERKGEEL